MKELLPVKIPRVARPASPMRVVPLAIAFATIGIGVFAGLASGRTARQDESGTLPAVSEAPTAVPAPVPLPQPATPTTTASPIAIPMTSAAPKPAIAQPIKPPSTALPSATNAESDGSSTKEKATKGDSAKAHRESPALIVDLGPTPAAFNRAGRLPLIRAALSDAPPESPTPIPTVRVPDPTGAAIAAAGPPADASRPSAIAVAPGGINIETNSSGRDLNSNERFAERAGNRETEVARAQRLQNQESLVVQGTMIAGVMETALNSDLPGYARAIVTRDVLSFDGSQVLIPAGSRVIGEYNSGVAQGASRIFIVWNRLIRPDGVTVSLGSPAVDDLGRGGLGGRVNRHFVQRFGGAILLSVLGSGANLLTQSLNHNSTVIVSSNSEASSLGSAVARPNDIAPTITTPQGAAVQIFVARDLDFSGVGPAV